jgi:hypothetical protein
MTENKMINKRKNRRRFEDIIGGVMTDKECKTIRTTVIAGIILMLVGTVGTQLALAWSTQKKLVAENAKLNNRLDNIALRTQGNMHDMATVIDVVRDMLWEHSFPKGTYKPYTPLATRIPDIPQDQKENLNHHIGDIPLVTDSSIK